MRVAREEIEWCDVWIPAVESGSDRPYVLLVGDSIASNYYPLVCGQLEGVVNCAKLATSACVADPAFHKQLDAAVGEYAFSLIHFNNGLHGVGYTEEEYRAGYEAALRWIERQSPETELVLALSTPLLETSDKNHLNARVDERNRIVRALAEERGAAVNDLHALSKGCPEHYKDPYHFKAEAVELQARQVGNAIKARFPDL